MTTEAGAGKAPDPTPAGSGAPAPAQPAGEAAKPNTPVTIPAELMPHVEKMFDERLAKVLPGKQAEWAQAEEAKRKQAEMSEVEKANARAAEFESKLATVTSDYTREKRIREVIGQGVSDLVAEGIVARLGADYTPEKAAEMAKPYIAQAGATPTPKFPGAGGAAGGSGTDGVPDEELQARVKRGEMKLEDFNKVMDQRRFAKANSAAGAA